MTQLLFYREIVPLDRENHRTARLRRPQDDAGFARDTHYVPVTGSEFEYAARDYPILFTGGDGDAGPVALLGLTAGHNPYVTDSESWRPGTYIPAFVRRYPFVLARADDDDYRVCIDTAYPGFGDENGESLFEGDGAESAWLKERIALVREYLADAERTRAFVERLEALDLLINHDLRITRNDGRTYTLRAFRFVDLQRLDQLPDEEIIRLQRDGHLAWIHAHRVSLAALAHLEAASNDDAGDRADHGEPMADEEPLPTEESAGAD